MKILTNVIRSAINKFLSEFVENLDEDALGVGLLAGHVLLRDVKLRPGLIESIIAKMDASRAVHAVEYGKQFKPLSRSPITLIAALLSKLEVIIPWSSIGSSPVTVRIDGLYIVLGPTPLADIEGSPRSKGCDIASKILDEEDESYFAEELLRFVSAKTSGKKKAAEDEDSDNLSDGAEQLRPTNPTTPSGPSTSTKTTGPRKNNFIVRQIKRYLAKILQNVEVDIGNVVFRYETFLKTIDPRFTTPTSEACVQLRLRRLFLSSAFDCKEDVSIVSSFIRKSIRLIALEGRVQQGKGSCFQSVRSDLYSLMLHDMWEYKVMGCGNGGIGKEFVNSFLMPCSINGHLSFRRKLLGLLFSSSMKNHDATKFAGDVGLGLMVTRLVVTASPLHINTILLVASDFEERLVPLQRPRLLSPLAGRKYCRLWWRLAIGSVIAAIHEEDGHNCRWVHADAFQIIRDFHIGRSHTNWDSVLPYRLASVAATEIVADTSKKNPLDSFMTRLRPLKVTCVVDIARVVVKVFDSAKNYRQSKASTDASEVMNIIPSENVLRSDSVEILRFSLRRLSMHTHASLEVGSQCASIIAKVRLASILLSDYSILLPGKQSFEAVAKDEGVSVPRIRPIISYNAPNDGRTKYFDSYFPNVKPLLSAELSINVSDFSFDNISIRVIGKLQELEVIVPSFSFSETIINLVNRDIVPAVVCRDQRIFRNVGVRREAEIKRRFASDKNIVDFSECSKLWSPKINLFLDIHANLPVIIFSHEGSLRHPDRPDVMCGTYVLNGGVLSCKRDDELVRSHSSFQSDIPYDVFNLELKNLWFSATVGRRWWDQPRSENKEHLLSDTLAQQKSAPKSLFEILRSSRASDDFVQFVEAEYDYHIGVVYFLLDYMRYLLMRMDKHDALYTSDETTESLYLSVMWDIYLRCGGMTDRQDELLSVLEKLDSERHKTPANIELIKVVREELSATTGHSEFELVDILENDIVEMRKVLRAFYAREKFDVQGHSNENSDVGTGTSGISKLFNFFTISTPDGVEHDTTNSGSAEDQVYNALFSRLVGEIEKEVWPAFLKSDVFLAIATIPEIPLMDHVQMRLTDRKIRKAKSHNRLATDMWNAIQSSRGSSSKSAFLQSLSFQTPFIIINYLNATAAFELCQYGPSDYYHKMAQLRTEISNIPQVKQNVASPSHEKMRKLREAPRFRLRVYCPSDVYVSLSSKLFQDMGFAIFDTVVSISSQVETVKSIIKKAKQEIWGDSQSYETRLLPPPPKNAKFDTFSDRFVCNANAVYVALKVVEERCMLIRSARDAEDFDNQVGLRGVLAAIFNSSGLLFYKYVVPRLHLMVFGLQLDYIPPGESGAECINTRTEKTILKDEYDVSGPRFSDAIVAKTWRQHINDMETEQFCKAGMTAEQDAIALKLLDFDSAPEFIQKSSSWWFASSEKPIEEFGLVINVTLIEKKSATNWYREEIIDISAPWILVTLNNDCLYYISEFVHEIFYLILSFPGGRDKVINHSFDDDDEHESLHGPECVCLYPRLRSPIKKSISPVTSAAPRTDAIVNLGYAWTPIVRKNTHQNSQFIGYKSIVSFEETVPEVKVRGKWTKVKLLFQEVQAVWNAPIPYGNTVRYEPLLSLIAGSPVLLEIDEKPGVLHLHVNARNPRLYDLTCTPETSAAGLSTLLCARENATDDSVFKVNFSKFSPLYPETYPGYKKHLRLSIHSASIRFTLALEHGLIAKAIPAFLSFGDSRNMKEPTMSALIDIAVKDPVAMRLEVRAVDPEIILRIFDALPPQEIHVEGNVSPDGMFLQIVNCTPDPSMMDAYQCARSSALGYSKYSDAVFHHVALATSMSEVSLLRKNQEQRLAMLRRRAERHRLLSEGRTLAAEKKKVQAQVKRVKEEIAALEAETSKLDQMNVKIETKKRLLQEHMSEIKQVRARATPNRKVQPDVRSVHYDMASPGSPKSMISTESHGHADDVEIDETWLNAFDR